MQRAFKLAAALTVAAAIAPSSAAARVVGIKLTQTRVKQWLRANPLSQALPRTRPLPGDLLYSRYNLQWLGNRLGYAPQPWPVGVALMTCRVTAYPRARCGARYTLARGGRIFAVGSLNFATRVTQRLQITGGTRRYRGASGSITIQRKTPTVRVLRFTVIT
jgi:hypothetical protein